MDDDDNYEDNNNYDNNNNDDNVNNDNSNVVDNNNVTIMPFRQNAKNYDVPISLALILYFIHLLLSM